MSFIELNLFSEALGMQTNVFVVMPQKSTSKEIGTTNNVTEEKYKCLYLLHGLSDDHTIWMRRTSIERYACEHGICVVMPMGARSFYTDMKYGLKYYTYIAQELPQMIENMLNVSKKREDRYIGGLSMGGYGALKIALKEKGKYHSAFALSPVSDIYNDLFRQTLIPVFGEAIPQTEDLFYLTSVHQTDSQKSRIYISVGTEDFMYDDTIRFNQHLQHLSYEYQYEEVVGGTHSWDLWDQTVQDALEWMLQK